MVRFSTRVDVPMNYLQFVALILTEMSVHYGHVGEKKSKFNLKILRRKKVRIEFYKITFGPNCLI